MLWLNHISVSLSAHAELLLLVFILILFIQLVSSLVRIHLGVVHDEKGNECESLLPVSLCQNPLSKNNVILGMRRCDKKEAEWKSSRSWIRRIKEDSREWRKHLMRANFVFPLRYTLSLRHRPSTRRRLHFHSTEECEWSMDGWAFLLLMFFDSLESCLILIRMILLIRFTCEGVCRRAQELKNPC